MKTKLLATLFLIASLTLAGCGARANSLIAQITLTPSKTAIVGKVMTNASGKTLPLTKTVVRLAIVFWNEDKSEGAFVLEGGSSPSAISNEKGEFAFTNLDPKDYVVVVGDMMGDNVIIAEPDGKAKIFTPESDKTLDIGVLEVSLVQP